MRTARSSRTIGAVLALVVVALGTVTAGSPASAAAAPIGSCTTTSGVILAVDFGHWGGPVLRSCGTTPTTGFALLNEGGWHTTGTGHDGPAFICRIGYDGWHGGTSYPTRADEPCVLTPPTSAYWSYWHADPGQNTWSYSRLGAMSYRPKPGSVDLWTFGATNTGGTTGSGLPTVSPNSLRAHNATPAGGTPKPAVTRTGAVIPTSRATARPGTTKGPTTGTAVPPSSAGAGTGPAPSGQPPIEDAPPTTAASRVDHGSTGPAITALVIVVLLAAGGIVAVLRHPGREQ